MKKILLRIILSATFGLIYAPAKAHDAGGKYAPKMSIRTTAPTVTDDRSKGYTEGSLWYDIINGEEYVCGDGTVGAAVWWHYGEVSQTESVTGDWTFVPNGDGGLTNYDISVGDTDGSPTYGMMNIGDASIGRTSYSAGSIDLDGTLLYRNIGGPVTSQIEHIFTESTGNTCRFALPKSGVGNATYNPRSMLIAGPAPADTDFVTVGYWQTNNSIFDNLVCDTAGSGADVGIQNDLEVEGDVFIDSINESTTNARVSFNDDILMVSAEKVLFRDTAIGAYSQADTFLDLFADGGVRIGNSSAGAPTSYSMFASDGELTLAGTARVIINDDVEITVPAKGLASPPDDGEEDNFRTLDFDDGDDEEIFFEYHLRHNYSPEGLIHIHVHFFTDAVPGGADETVEWSLEYKKVSEGEAFNFSVGTNSTTATQVLTSGDTVTEIYETPALALTTTDFQPDNHILMRLHRNGGAGNDDYVGDARLFRIHIEYLSNKLGETT